MEYSAEDGKREGERSIAARHGKKKSNEIFQQEMERAGHNM